MNFAHQVPETYAKTIDKKTRMVYGCTDLIQSCSFHHHPIVILLQLQRQDKHRLSELAQNHINHSGTPLSASQNPFLSDTSLRQAIFFQSACSKKQLNWGG
jgi:hypothetical protein